jgi:hypothetical protein
VWCCWCAAVCASTAIDAVVNHRTSGILARRGHPQSVGARTENSDGKPDLSGMWITAPANALPCGRGLVECGIELPMSREGGYMGASVSGGLPYQPWAAELVKKNMETSSKDDPHGLCLPDTFLRAYGLPHIVKFIQTPQLLIALEEYNADYRQVFSTVGRCRASDFMEGIRGAGRATRSSLTPSVFATTCGSTSAAVR